MSQETQITQPHLEYEIDDSSLRNDSFFLFDISHVPHHVLIVYQKLYCSGSLIKSKIVATAASCFVMMTDETKVIVKVGASTMTDIREVIEVLEVKKHEYFGRRSDLDNDIALVLLKDHVTFSNNVKKIHLKEDLDSKQVKTTNIVRVCGYGSADQDAQYVNHLLCSDMTVTNSTNCRDLYQTFLGRGNFCLKYYPDFRLSDNGGPVVVNDEQLIGIVSYGANREKPPYIALATNISYYSRWIKVNIRRFLEKYCKPTPANEYYSDSETELESSHS